MPTSKPAPRAALEDPSIPQAVRALASRGEVRRYAKGVLLIQEGDVGDTVYVILEGRLRAFATEPSTGREFTYDVYGPGQIVGEMGLDGGPRSANVIAMEPCICAVIARPTLLLHIKENPEFAFELLTKVIARARACTLAAKMMALIDVYGRLRLYLHAHSQPRADGTRLLAEPPKHRELAERLGCVRERVTTVLNDLKSTGHLRETADGWCIVEPLPERL